MSSPATARLACASPQFVEQATDTELRDWLSYFDPAVVVLCGNSAHPRAMSTLRRSLDSDVALVNPTGRNQKSVAQTIDSIPFLFVPSPSDLEALLEEKRHKPSSETPTFIVSGLLSLDIDTTTLSTSLVGYDQYVSALTPSQLRGEYINISTRLPANYRREWDGLRIVGGGAKSGYADTPLVALDCREDGRVLTRTLQPARLGLQALDGIGPKRAQCLYDEGFQHREDIADASLSTLAELQGLGQTTAKRIQQSAQAIAEGEIIRTSDDPLPSGEPVYIDIETDGLTPTITWLIGVLDGSAADGDYLSFTQTNPDDPGGAIEEFMSWYTSNANHRPLVAYNGWEFDFDILRDHIIEYCPHYEEEWNKSYRFDPYQWAIKDGNAILPGRTNKLEDVAAALGHESADTGLTGAAVARAYQQWMIDRSTETELDWEQYEAYCEDDVRALAVIYEALQESGRLVSTEDPSPNIEETTTQGNLSDW